MEIVHWVVAHATELALAVSSLIGFASVIVKLTPTQTDNDFLAKVVGFLSKYIALNTDKHLD